MNKYEYKYYLQKTYSANTNMNNILDTVCHKYEQGILFLEISTKILKYLKIIEYLKSIKSQNTATYQSEDWG